ncbi:MAG: orotidine-5'-phosphate decarboxylase [Gammaproteobacteria bacterium]|nr:MAG: orotidine-5'-phosphate decarboxylase [Gammaproteobacteria bacterium]
MTHTPIIVALDFPDAKKADNVAQTLDPTLVRLKVGKELFVAEGPRIVEKLQRLGFDIFLDLKFHDIPNTVAKACLEAAKLGVWMTNVHAFGGQKMMSHVMETLSTLNQRPLITAVTVLTSMDERNLHSLGINTGIMEQVSRLAALAKDSGLDGVVCSAQEAQLLRQQLGDDFLLVTPGIRLPDDRVDDQHRIMTPEKALQAGATHLVIGRPITQAKDPQKAVETIIQRLN